MPNYSTYYSEIRFDFFDGPPISVDNEYICDFSLHDVRQDWCWFQWHNYHIHSECEGCYFVFRPAVSLDNKLNFSEELREHLKQKITEFFERLRIPDLWMVTIRDDDGTRHKIFLPTVWRQDKADGSMINELQTVHFAKNGWVYVILGSKEYTERCVQRLAWVDDARADGQPTIMERKEKRREEYNHDV